MIFSPLSKSVHADQIYSMAVAIAGSERTARHEFGVLSQEFGMELFGYT